MWHATGDTWNVTGDTWYVTDNIWHFLYAKTFLIWMVSVLLTAQNEIFSVSRIVWGKNHNRLLKAKGVQKRNFFLAFFLFSKILPHERARIFALCSLHQYASFELSVIPSQSTVMENNWKKCQKGPFLEVIGKSIVILCQNAEFFFAFSRSWHFTWDIKCHYQMIFFYFYT